MKLLNEPLGSALENASRHGALFRFFEWQSWLILAFALIAHVLAFDSEINLYDEGIILVGADSVLSGKLPYKDFWTMYGPGQFYLAAWLFSIFEPADLFVRAIGITAKSAIVMMTYVMIGRVANRLFALTGAVIALGMLIGLLHQDAFPIFPAVAFSMGAILLLENGLFNRPIYLMAAGFCTGIASCFRHDLGAYSALASGLSILIVHLIGTFRGQILKAGIVAVKQTGYYMMGVLSVIVPVAGLLLYSIPLADLYENLFLIPAGIYPKVRALPWPGIDLLKPLLWHPDDITALAVYAPFITCAAVFVVEFLKVKSLQLGGDFLKVSLKNGWFFLLVTGLTCLLFTLKGLVRVSLIHMAQSLVLTVILILVSLSRISCSTRLNRIIAFFVLVPTMGLVVMSSLTGFIAVKNGFKDLINSKVNLISRCVSPVSPRMRCVSADSDYLRAARFVKDHSGNEDTIYVGVGRHDKVFINAVAFYFMAERRPATKWYELHPGVQTQASVQAKMISEMETTPPRLVILDERWDGVEEPNASRIPSGEKLLDRYLDSKYIETNRFGTIRVLTQRRIIPTN